MTNDTIETIGCDLGDKQSEICVLGVDGEQAAQRRCVRRERRSDAVLYEGPAHVVIEVGAHSRWVSDAARRAGPSGDRREPATGEADLAEQQQDGQARRGACWPDWDERTWTCSRRWSIEAARLRPIWL